MKIKAYESEFGKITYRLPNALDVPDLLAVMDLTVAMKAGTEKAAREMLEAMEFKDRVALEMRMKSSVMRVLDKFITDIEMDFGDGPITTWAELIEDAAAAMPLMAIANEVMMALQGLDAKKKKRSKLLASSTPEKSPSPDSSPAAPPSSGTTSEA